MVIEVLLIGFAEVANRTILLWLAPLAEPFAMRSRGVLGNDGNRHNVDPWGLATWNSSRLGELFRSPRTEPQKAVVNAIPRLRLEEAMSRETNAKPPRRSDGENPFNSASSQWSGASMGYLYNGPAPPTDWL